MKSSNVMLMVMLIMLSFALQADDHADFYNNTGYTVTIHTKSKHHQKNGQTRHDEDNFVLKPKETHAFSCNGDLEKITMIVKNFSRNTTNGSWEDKSFYADGHLQMDSIRKCGDKGGILFIDQDGSQLILHTHCK